MVRLLLVLVLSFFCALSVASDKAVQADRDYIERIEPRLREDKLYIDVDAHLILSSELRNAAEKGIPLYFVAEVEIFQPRWWWFNKKVVKEQQTWRIVYNALTRQWRVGTSDLYLPESSLDDALALIRHIRGWALAYAIDLDRDVEYEGRVRIRLDTSLLARPFQVDAINSSSWSLITPWKSFSFSVSVDEPQP